MPPITCPSPTPPTRSSRRWTRPTGGDGRSIGTPTGGRSPSTPAPTSPHFRELSRLRTLLLERTRLGEDDARRLHQVLLDLATRALDWGDRKGIGLVATVHYRWEEAAVVIALRDRVRLVRGRPPAEARRDRRPDRSGADRRGGLQRGGAAGRPHQPPAGGLNAEGGGSAISDDRVGHRPWRWILPGDRRGRRTPSIARWCSRSGPGADPRPPASSAGSPRAGASRSGPPARGSRRSTPPRREPDSAATTRARPARPVQNPPVVAGPGTPERIAGGPGGRRRPRPPSIQEALGRGMGVNRGRPGPATRSRPGGDRPGPSRSGPSGCSATSPITPTTRRWWSRSPA